MTELLVDVPAGPQAHALVIGVGHYRHFRKGDEYNSKLKIQGEQLTSPPLSARAFADWLLRRDGQGYTPPPPAPHELPPAPLASLELLVSTRERDLTRYTRPDTGAEVQIDGATHANVTLAFERWRDRIWDDPNAVGFFYFCGHGLLAGGSVALLLEDFGKDAKNPFLQAFDFDTTRFGLATAQARRQYFFVDACQAMARKYRVRNPAAPLQSREDDSVPSPEGAVFYGAAATTKAYAPKKGISNFTAALIEGLNGLATQEDEDTHWVVKPVRLYETIGEILRYRGGDGPAQIPAGDLSFSRMHTIGENPPVVPCTVWCDPDEVHQLARLSVHDGIEEVDADPKTARRWEFALPKREYKLLAEFDNGDYERYEKTFDVRPPLARRRVTTTSSRKAP